jgi:hypothetical protein
VRTFSISPAGLRGLVWRSARLSFAIAVLLIAITMRFSFSDEEPYPRTLIWILTYLFLVLVAGTGLAVRSARRLWSAFHIELENDCLRRVQSRLPDVSITREETTEIEEMPGRGLTVRTADSEKFIYVPTAVEDYAALRAELATWKPVNTLSIATTWTRQWAGVTAAMLVVGWMVAAMLSTSLAFAAPSAFAISVFLLWTFVAAQQSLHLDRRTKLAMWLVFFPILALTLRCLRLLEDLR